MIPKEVIEILEKLNKAGFEVYAVGGCVRDFLFNKKPKDWDIATSAQPEQIQKIFPKNFYANEFGTVTAKTESQDETLKEIQITPYRAEEKYSDKRHPDAVKFGVKLEDDLARRDFTINAMALRIKNQELGIKNYEIVDLFDGQEDLKNKIIRAVGEPSKRFEEDALRMMRAVRFAAELGFSAGWRIEPKTFEAIKENSKWLQVISKERIRDELIKILESDGAESGIFLLRDAGLLHFVLPELEEGIGVSQNKHHIYTVFDHNVYSLGFAVKFGFNLEVRMASLLHDVGKPKSKRGNGADATFYGHDVVGAKMSYQALERLKFPKKFIEKVALLIRYHLFYYNVGEVTLSSVRRLLLKAGVENIKDLLNLRIAERKGSGVPKAVPYKLRHFEYMVEKVMHDPLSVKMLKINGEDVMKILKIASGPKIGYILKALLNEVLDDPKRNSKEYLESEVKNLGKFSDTKLKAASKEAEIKIGEGEEKWEEEVKKKHYVK